MEGRETDVPTATAGLAESSVFEATRDGLICFDPAGRVTTLNAAAEGIFDVRREATLGSEVETVFTPHHLESGQPIFWSKERVCRAGLSLESEEPVLLRRADGSERYVTFRATPIKRATKITGGMLVITDCSERVRLERQVIKSQRHESVSLMAGGVAHDFNNILTGVLGNLSLVAAMESDPRIRQSVQSAEKAADRARTLAKQFLSLCRREREHGAPRVFDVGELLREACTLITCGTQCRYSIEVAAGAETMFANEDQMSQVFNNLIINAVQAMDGSGAIEIRVKRIQCRRDEAQDLCVEPGAYYSVDIEDDGPGISQKDSARIFDPYFTTKKDGNGLGLASCRMILRRHGGTLTVSSHPGRGTCFSCIIPAREQDADALNTPSVNASELHTGMGRILVMDDESMIRQIAGDMLELLGYEAALCADGESMLDEYRRAAEAGERYDAVILDLTIPGKMGGREAMEKLLEYDSEALGIVSSGYAHDPVMEDPEKHGFTLAMQKPYTVQEFSSVLGKVKVK